MIRIYLTPFDDSGDFGDEIEITADVDMDSIGKITRSLDSSDYDIGVLRYNSFSLKLQNYQGKYSNIDNLKSIFRFRRSGAKVRVTWAPDDFAICGSSVCGETILAEEIDIYFGLLNDDTTTMGTGDQIIEFQVLSYDSQFSNILVPFDDLEDTDTLTDILLKILNQPDITKYMIVDSGNLNLAVDYIPDDLSSFENQTGDEAIQDILLGANSVIYIEGNIVKTKDRSPASNVSLNFFGQASELGNENILDLYDFRNGQNRLINFVRYGEDGPAFRNVAAIQYWGVKLKEVDLDFVTDSSKQAATANAIIDEFKDPEIEFTVDLPMSPDNVSAKFLDKINFDCPPVVDSAGQFLPKVGLTKIGDVRSPLPNLLWDFRLTQDQEFKIMGFEYDLKNEIVSYNVRGAA